MSAAAAGASTVIASERNRFLYQRAAVVREATRAGSIFARRRSVLDATIDTTRLEDIDDRPVDVVLTDRIDHAGFGLGLLPAIDRVADARLAVPDAVFAPSRVVVRAALLRLRVEDVAGFDLRSLNAYRWHPQAAKSGPSTGTDPRVSLGTVRRVRGGPRREVPPKTERFRDVGSRRRRRRIRKSRDVGIRRDGSRSRDVRRGVERGRVLDRSGPRRRRRPRRIRVDDGRRDGARRRTRRKTRRVVPRVVFAPRRGPPPCSISTRCGWTPARRSTFAFVETRTRCFSPPSRPRRDGHRTPTIPAWHYDMLNDTNRNDAYDAAITDAVRARRGPNGARPCVVLDAGSGSGLLSMMAARAGATRAYAVERSAHVTDAGEEVVCVNGLAGVVTCVHRDVRSVFTAETEGLPTAGGRAMKPDGGVPEMETKADVAAYEIFDSGLIGEGALHALAAARARLLVPDAALVPASAVVYAQVIEMRHAEVACGPDPRFRFDLAAANRWRWRPEYEGVDLDKRRRRWRPRRLRWRRFASTSRTSPQRRFARRRASSSRAWTPEGRATPSRFGSSFVWTSGEASASLPLVRDQGADVATGGTVRGGVRSATGRPTPARRQTRHVRRIVRGERRDVSEGGETHGGTAVRPDVGGGPRARGKGARGVGARRRAIAARVSSGGGDGGRRGRATRGLWIGRLRGCRLVREDDGVRRGEARAEGKGWKIERRRFTRKTRLG